MERRKVGSPISSIQKTIKRQKLKKNQNNQHRGKIQSDTFGLKENSNKHERNNMNIHELRDELLHQNLTK